MNTTNLIWSEPIVDSYNIVTKTATVVFNFDFSNEDTLEKILSYSVAYILWVARDLPKQSRIIIIYDLRGLIFSNEKEMAFRDRIKKQINKIENHIKVEFVFNR